MNVELRAITLEDSPNIVKWRNNPCVKENLYSQEDLTLENHISYFHNYVEKGLVKQFIILVDDNPCGTSFLKNINEETKKAEFGIFIGEDQFRGKGVGKEAIRKTIEFGFKELGLKTIYLTVLANNFSAINSYLAVGFKTSKMTKNGYSRNDIHYDVVEMEISPSIF